MPEETHKWIYLTAQYTETERNRGDISNKFRKLEITGPLTREAIKEAVLPNAPYTYSPVESGDSWTGASFIVQDLDDAKRITGKIGRALLKQGYAFKDKSWCQD